MKQIFVIGSACALALSVTLASAQAPAKAPAPAAKADPAVAQCRAHNQAEHKSLVQMHAKAVKEHNISKAEENHYRQMEARLHKHQATLAKGGLTLDECQKLGKEIEHEKAEVAKMAASPAKAPAKK